MPTNRDRLQRTLEHTHEVWRAEQSRQRKNAVNESAWTVEAIEPVLAALDWPRLRQGDLGGRGAYYEWPTKNKVDGDEIAKCRNEAGFELIAKALEIPKTNEDA